MAQPVNNVVYEEQVIADHTSDGGDLPPKSLNLMPTEKLLSRLQTVLNDIQRYKQLLRYTGSDAQKLLDFFQSLLDSQKLDQTSRRRVTVAIQRISTSSGLYPTCYQLKGVVQDSEHPIMAGGFADIYQGTFQAQKVCIKAIRIYQNTDVEHLLKQVAKEAVLWGQLRNLNLLPIYGVYRFRNQVCLVAPWMERGDINTYLKNNPHAPRPLLASDVAHGLSYLHMNGIIHGDLKGPNILIDDVGRARVADFGISSISDPEIVAWTSHSSASSKGGSIRWQAPELFDMENDELVKNSEASDVYAWSCVCFEIFTGDVPFFNVPRDAAVIHQIKLGVRPARPPESSPSWLVWGLTDGLWTLMEDCWKADPHARPTISEAIERSGAGLVSDNRTEAADSRILSPAIFRQGMAQPLDATILTLIDKLLANYTEAGYGSTPDSTVDDLFMSPCIHPSAPTTSSCEHRESPPQKAMWDNADPIVSPTDTLRTRTFMQGSEPEDASVDTSISHTMYSLHEEVNDSQNIETPSPLTLTYDSESLLSLTRTPPKQAGTRSSSSSGYTKVSEKNVKHRLISKEMEPFALILQSITSSIHDDHSSKLSDTISRMLKVASQVCPMRILREITDLALNVTLTAKNVKSHKYAFITLAEDACELVCMILLDVLINESTDISFHNSLRVLKDTMSSMLLWAKKEASRNMLERIFKRVSDHAIDEYRVRLLQSSSAFGVSLTLSIYENFTRRVQILADLQTHGENSLLVQQGDIEKQLEISTLAEQGTNMDEVVNNRTAHAILGPSPLQFELTPDNKIDTTQVMSSYAQEERVSQIYTELIPESSFGSPLSVPSQGVGSRYVSGIVTSVGGSQNTLSPTIINSNTGDSTTTITVESNNNTSLQFVF